MSSFTSELLDFISTLPPEQAWQEINSHLWEKFSTPIAVASADSEIVRRDRSITELENALSGSCWDLWNEFETSLPKASNAIVDFWNRINGGKGVLILDGLSLRESPWLLQQASDRGYTIHAAGSYATELPCETTPFAKSLGFSQRSALESSSNVSPKLKNSSFGSESSSLNWQDCIKLVGNHESFIFWHHFPDIRLHDLSVPGEGLLKFARETRDHFMSDDFWAFVERMAMGRRLVITSDHGYAACGLFPDITDKDQVEYMRALFKSGRTSVDKAAVNVEGDQSDTAPWVPPLDLRLTTSHGSHRYVLGRRKWKSAGGYPTLHHGGLSLLEVFVPLVELSKG